MVVPPPREGFYACPTRRKLERPICIPLSASLIPSLSESNDARISDPSPNDEEMMCETEVPLWSHSEGYVYPMTWVGPWRDHSQVQNENIGMSFTSGVLTSSQSESPLISNSLFADTEVLIENNGMTSASGVLTNSQTNQPPLNQFETFEAPHRTRPGGRRPTLTEEQRKENKKTADSKYRGRKKEAEAKLTAKNIHLEEENAKLIAEKTELKGQLLTRDEQIPALIAEIKRLQEENVKLIAEKKELTGQLLTRDGQLPAEAPQRQGQDTYIAQSTSELLDHPSVSVQVSGSEMNDSQNSHQTIPINAVATDNDVTENQKNSRTGTCYDNTNIEHLLEEIDEDVTSNVRSSDFTGLDGERIKIGKYNFPPSLRPVVERIDACYGDASATCKVNLESVEATYVLFCASLREMDDLGLEGVSKDRILKWRDAIKDALRMGLKVDFAMDHLKKIAHAYIGRIKSQELMNMTEGISKLEADLNSRKEELAKRKELSKKDMDAAEEFNGKSLSLFT